MRKLFDFGTKRYVDSHPWVSAYALTFMSKCLHAMYSSAQQSAANTRLVCLVNAAWK
jgi:hypothetical protein